MTNNRREILSLAVVLVASLAIYLPALSNALVFDDLNILESQAAYAHLWDGMRATQQTQLDQEMLHTVGYEVPYDSYRPLLFLSYRLDLLLFDLRPAAMRLHSLLIGLLNVVLLGWLLRRLRAPSPVVVAVAGALMLHPLQVEPLVYVSARGDLLAAFWSLVSLHAAWSAIESERWRANVGWSAVAALTWFIGLLFKESWVGLPLAVGGFAWSTRRVRASLPVGVGWILALLAYVALRMTVVGATGASLGRTSTLSLLTQIPGLAAQGFGVFLAPVDLSVQRLPDAGVGWASLAYLGVIPLLAWSRREGANPALRISAAAFFAAMVLVAPAMLVVNDQNTVADRYFYLSVPLWTAGITIWWNRIRVHVDGRLLAGLAGVVAVTYVLFSALQVRVWQSNETLYQRACAVAPEHPMSWYRLGVEYARQQRWEECIQVTGQALALDPENAQAHNNIGVAYLNTNELDLAARHFNAAVVITDGLHYRAIFNLAIVHLRAGHHAEGCSLIAHTLEVNPAYRQAHDGWSRWCTPEAPAP